MNAEIKTIPLVVVTGAIAVVLLYCLVFASTAPPQAGSVLPDTNLPVPGRTGERNYLGLEGGAYFKIPEIKAQVVIIEIFSMYCPYCQREAPEINRLYSIIDKSLDLKGKIKLVGIGAGNSPFEVQVFKEKYTVPFPLFSDEDFTLHKCFGEVRTPYFIGVKINDDGSHRIFYSKLGEFKGAEPFLGLMLQLSGLQ
ncbi:MAG: redoxin domain-containing protein [Deltaproteobacteria bacterium]|nr:redoxin domain-containing protein [Deltaproteobacteria bacterium]